MQERPQDAQSLVITADKSLGAQKLVDGKRARERSRHNAAPLEQRRKRPPIAHVEKHLRIAIVDARLDQRSKDPGEITGVAWLNAQEMTALTQAAGTDAHAPGPVSECCEIAIRLARLEYVDGPPLGRGPWAQRIGQQYARRRRGGG